MELTDLTRNQQFGLVALIEKIAMSDGTVAEGEQKEIGKIADKLGEDKYRELLDDVDERIQDKAALREFLTTITDQEARDLIYGTAMEESMLAPSVNHEQSELLEWLKGEWSIRIEDT